MRNRLLRNAPAFLLGALLASPALADTTTLTVAAASKGTSSVPVSLPFPVNRSGDLGYPIVLNYHTVDGTALAGTDYTAVSGTIMLPANAAGGTIPVTLSANTGSTDNLTLQLQLDSVVGVGPTPQMSAQQTFATGTAPYSVTAADLNGDGKPDLIAANRSDNTVSVLLNTTAPGAATHSFAAQQTFATGLTPFSVTAADLNGDGKPDLIVANQNSNTVSVLLNTTAPGAALPSFAALQTFATGAGPASVSAADLNGDGKPDLIVVNASDTVSVLLNTTASGPATSSFAVQQTFATGTAPIAVTTADLNGDGKPDLIVANHDDNTVRILFNTTAPGAATP
ncbi:MAG TPA: FG-GAP-like repeat-containing protein, partial [Rudaea sp.]|nr:FG-GAP-like repeat-containing protein [Rudaea sp.]